MDLLFRKGDSSAPRNPPGYWPGIIDRGVGSGVPTGKINALRIVKYFRVSTNFAIIKSTVRV